LIVDSDMPPKKFHISHSGVLHIRNLDPALTREDISAAFDEFSSRTRMMGSVDFVTCEAGKRTGEAYVGFDTPGEAEAAIRAFSGVLKLGNCRSNLRSVKDRQIPGKPAVVSEHRPERSVEELIDDLDNWERYVDPEDVKILEQHGVNKIVLDEALRAIRYNNKSFGAFDASIRSEALEPTSMQGGQYKELVEMYVAALKGCLATPEDVGEMYENLHLPGEELDLSIFDQEKERQKRLLDHRQLS
jgi:RNA recognition motif-containing protein